jgi:hypothetical protein
MVKKRVPPPVRGCPNSCTDRSGNLQRPITDIEFGSLAANARTAVYQSHGRCFICAACGRVYIREVATDVVLGRIVNTESGSRWMCEEVL